MMIEILRAGGFTTGGMNFDAKIRRQSIEPDDLLHAHVGSMDATAKALLNAEAIIKDGALQKFVDDRYAGWKGSARQGHPRRQEEPRRPREARRGQEARPAAEERPAGISGGAGQPVHLRHANLPRQKRRDAMPGRRRSPLRAAAVRLGDGRCAGFRRRHHRRRPSRPRLACGRRTQSLVIQKYIARLTERTRLIVCSGNHDLDADSAGGREGHAVDLNDARDRVGSDGDSVDFGDTLFTICPWWDGPVAREAIGAQLAADAAKARQRWIWIYHAPPDRSPVELERQPLLRRYRTRAHDRDAPAGYRLLRPCPPVAVHRGRIMGRSNRVDLGLQRGPSVRTTARPRRLRYRAEVSSLALRCRESNRSWIKPCKGGSEAAALPAWLTGAGRLAISYRRERRSCWCIRLSRISSTMPRWLRLAFELSLEIDEIGRSRH